MDLVVLISLLRFSFLPYIFANIFVAFKTFLIEFYYLFVNGGFEEMEEDIRGYIRGFLNTTHSQRQLVHGPTWLGLADYRCFGGIFFLSNLP